ncbi:rhodanese-like domain-containing protein [Vibrio hangzhouensis]|uniref:rhodanese-like domain-containing protein n=1 Tax=Vibrio hangzhouensis TaxID=462991 RepID=UPI001C945EB2|nr:rhodanese-like domain-containing protein [Vibrio hangzhouensis]MBY6198123.1 rhodanese-like domain-containing protein [Vibrio hangzhouensis]
MDKKYLIFPMLLLTPLAFGADLVGKVQSMSGKGKVIQYLNTKTQQVEVLKFNDDTTLENADAFSDFTVNTKFKAKLDDNNLALNIKRVLVELPPELVIDTDELSELIEANQGLFIGDARPKSVFDVGHLPNAKATPATKLAKNLDWLPTDKATPMVFYCGGVTCPLSPKAMKIAKENGYSNVKVYVEGYPAWKGDMYPSYVAPDWLEQNLNIHNVILDVRESQNVSVRGSVTLPASELASMHETWNNEKKPVAERTVFALRDKKAPITLVSNADDEAAIEAYEILSSWGFKNVSILEQGIEGWKQASRPMDKALSELTYVKKPKPGALDGAAFAAAVKGGEALIIDVRDDNEVAKGKLNASIHIPLETLDQNLANIPKDKPIIFHCAAGARAALAYTTLIKLGYSNVQYLDDSFVDVVKENGIKLI